MQVDASRSARNYIRHRGRKLFIWFTPVKLSDMYLKQHVAHRRPPRVEFTTFDADGFTVYFDAQRMPPTVITLRRSWLGGIGVTGTGVGTISFADGDPGG
jgi:hypothetical protein